MAEAIGLPPGFRFMPSDEDLVASYLFEKSAGLLSPIEATLVPEYDVYSKEPLELFEKFDSNSKLWGPDLYFFTKLKKKGSRIDRTVGGAGGGCWHGEDFGKKVAAEGNIEGEKKRFSYRNKGSKQHSGYTMQEFSLPKFGCEWVLCRLRKNDSSAGFRVRADKKRKLEEKNAEVVVMNSETQFKDNTIEAMDNFMQNLFQI